MNLQTIDTDTLKLCIEDGDGYVCNDNNGVDVLLSMQQVKCIVRWYERKWEIIG